MSNAIQCFSPICWWKRGAAPSCSSSAPSSAMPWSPHSRPMASRSLITPITSALNELGAADTLLLDGSRIVDAIGKAIPPVVHRIEAANPSTAFKARKNAAELDHIREVMRRDGAALVCAFRRLEQRLAAGMTLTELDVDKLLYQERSSQPGYQGESFATIAGYQANGALPH